MEAQVAGLLSTVTLLSAQISQLTVRLDESEANTTTTATRTSTALNETQRLAIEAQQIRSELDAAKVILSNADAKHKVDLDNADARYLDN